MNILGVDPGRDKTGLAVVDQTGAILWRAVVETSRLELELQLLLEKWPVERVALGNSTSSKAAQARIAIQTKNRDIAVELVDEKNSTLEARTLYFEAHPPRGWKRLLPLSAQVPPVPVDDFAAVIVARRLLAQETRQ